MHYNLTAYVLLIILKCFCGTIFDFLRLGIEAHDSLVEVTASRSEGEDWKASTWVLQPRSGLFSR